MYYPIYKHVKHGLLYHKNYHGICDGWLLDISNKRILYV